LFLENSRQQDGHGKVLECGLIGCELIKLKDPGMPSSGRGFSNFGTLYQRKNSTLWNPPEPTDLKAFQLSFSDHGHDLAWGDI
jgi:hypothetical protein